MGDYVKVGDVLGTAGSTGNSGGFHLDYQIKTQYEGIIDPILFEQIRMSEYYYMDIPKSINVNGSDGSQHCIDYLKKIRIRYNLEKNIREK